MVTGVLTPGSPAIFVNIRRVLTFRRKRVIMDLSREFEDMWKKRGDAYRPRTRHLDERGMPVYTNRLFLETSPYLLQHAHNPVDWYPWGEAAFDTARRQNRPVLLSVGYSTCHWCHVMEEESFEDEEIAHLINANYIAVKVDREERPDVDAIYMSAVQAVAGRGGWPMTVFLTPQREPFYGGTYFPARDGDRGSPMGFLTLLKRIREAYDRRREAVERSAAELTQSVRRMLAPATGSRLPGESLLERAVSSAKNRFDALNGGLAGAPKFPATLPIRLLLRHWRRSGDRDCLKMATLTLEKMAAGGIYDQVGGGFHRYSTDEKWLVPHFEKMLYDNALLVPIYIEAWQATGNPRFKAVVDSTLDYVAREMTAPEGAFFAATDADSMTPAGKAEEGYYFTWTIDELNRVLEPDDARIAARVYGLTPAGNFEGRNVLHLPRSAAEAAAALKISTDALTMALQRINARLYAQRLKRPAPLRDEKILTAWNGLMISAFARAGFAFSDADAIDRACRAANFILEKMFAGGRLGRSYKDGKVAGGGFLEDYTCFTAALLDLFAVTASPHWLKHALGFDAVLAGHFEDPAGGGYFMTPDDHEAMIAREKPYLDGAVPSGNSLAMMNLLRLHALTLDAAFGRRAEKGLSAFSAVMETNPAGFGEMLLALNDHLQPPPQVIAVSPEGAHDRALIDRLKAAFLPGSLVMVVTPAQAAGLSEVSTLFRQSGPLAGKHASVYICRNGACGPPVNDADALMRQLDT
jgi:uncharacterized protein